MPLANTPTFWGLSDTAWVALGSIGTVGALVVALALGLWANGLSGWFFKPRLTIRLTPGFADFCPVDATTTLQHGNQVIVHKVADQY